MPPIRRVFQNRAFTVTVSAISILLCVVAIIVNSLIQQSSTNKKAAVSFENTVITMNTVVEGYLSSEQDTCDGWANYINNHTLTVDEALAVIQSSNTNPVISAQIVNLDTFVGKSTKLGVVSGDDMSVATQGFETLSYTNQYSSYRDIRTTMFDMAHGNDKFNITSYYTNPLNGKKVIAFIRGIRVIDDDGILKTMALLMITPSSMFDDLWVFPNSYSEANVEIINLDGKYLSNTKLLGHGNFYQYIKEHNDLTLEQMEQLRSRIDSKDSGYSIYDIADGQSTMFVHSTLKNIADNWIIIAYLPISALDTVQFDMKPLIFLCITFIVLFVVNFAYLNEVNYKLAQSLRDTQRANAAKTDFLATMSHDIRTPMNAIIGMTTIAEKNITDKRHVEECLKKINLSSNHLLTLINDILDISKIESGQYAINPIVFPLSELMDNIFNIVRQTVRSKGLKLEIHTHNITQEYLYADQLRLNQIYINILTNAVKYTNSGGRVTVDLYEAPSAVLENGVQLVYRVEDTGIGMSKEFMSRMYESFAREVDGRIDVIQGTGLGLAITKQLVDLMGGTIEAESELRRGTVFTVTLDLPIAEGMTDEIMLPEVSMIVIDDDRLLLETAKDTLRQIGIDADTADSGAKGIDMIMQRHIASTDYQVIILDWLIPDISGLEITRKIRKEIGEDIPIIIVSSYDYTEIQDEALEAGVNAFISKPLFKSTICKTLGSLLNIGNRSVPGSVELYDISGMNIIIAEDNALNYEIAEYLLNDLGATCYCAENGEVCVDMVKNDTEHRYDLILMDVQMPVMKGDEATKHIRELEDTRLSNIPIIAMTADAFAENIDECLDAGMDGHISKPINIVTVLTEIQRVMSKRQ